MVSDKDLYNLLLESQIIAEENLKKVSKQAEDEKKSLYDILLQNDLISDENLGKLISDHLKLPFILLSKVAIPKDLLTTIPQSVAQKQQTIVFGKSDSKLKIATSNPENSEFEKALSKKTGLNLDVYYATPRDIEEALALYKKEIKSTFDQLLKGEKGNDLSKLAEAPITEMVDTVIEYAYENKASDIHIEPEEEESLVRFRIDGILHDELKLPRNLHDQIITRIKVLARLRTDEHFSAQDGKMQVKLEAEDLDIRVSIVPIVNGEKAVLRLLSSRSRQFGLSDLGMQPEDLKKVEKAFNKPYGMILSTGPTGSGKTTTIYAILKILNSREKNIASIEDPVEYDIEGINQIQVNPKTNLTFAEGLRAILRQDPDIIYVGEIRDDETADIAVNSALTGHLVLSTLHTNDATTSLPRLIDMGIEPFLVSSTVNVIVAQRLVRKICEKCKTSKVVPTEELAKYVSKQALEKNLSTQKEIRVFYGQGCPVCRHTGFFGRIGIFEVLEVSDSIRNLINNKADSDSLAKKATEEGMTTMLDDGLRKVQLGLTTIEEILRATKEQIT